ncbi:ATP-binding protein [Halosimplex pelagicum]|uniref:ATP-binding protein n=2 Tax=Halosimplex pelagicum TaxID=869886 RepID=A0A7D5PAT6_9EURY|nr:ATP-binding protein [Halosimplex pelagicum]
MSDNIDDILDNDPIADDADGSVSDQTDEQRETDDQSNDSEVPERSVPSGASAPADDELGHILASEEIHVSRQDYQVNAFVRTGARDDVRLGDYVQVPYPDEDSEMFAVTDTLRYEPYTDLDDKSDAHNQISAYVDLNESEYVQVAELEPLAILKNVGSDDIESGIVNRIPKPNSPARLARDEACLRTGLNIPGKGIFTGWLSVGGEAMTVDGENFPYYLSNPGIDRETGDTEDGEPAVFRHALVAGSTGKGKTHFTKNVLRQFVSEKRYPIRHHDTGEEQQRRLNLVIIDPENEYWEMRDDNEAIVNDDSIQRELRQHGIKRGGVDDLEVFIPQVAGTNAPSTMESRELSIPFEIVRGRPEMLMPYTPTEVTRGAIEDCISAYFSCFDGQDNYPERGVERPKYMDFLAFLNEHDEDNSRLRTDNDIGGGTWSAVNRRVDRDTFRNVFDQGTEFLPDISDEVFRGGQVSVIPTSHLNGGKERLAVLSILSYIIENKIDDYQVDSAVRNTPMLVAVDEAHNYFASADSLREEYILRRARVAVKQGRKYKLGLCLITQNPDDVDDDVIKQINTNVFLGLKAEVVDSVSSIPSEFKKDLPNFGKGQAVVKAPDVEAVEVVGLPYCLTKHGN